jgi:hypothetical protein
MVADPVNVVDTLLGVQYDGTNSADIIALDVFDFNNSSEAAGVWTFQSPPESTVFVVHTGEWILFAQNQVLSRVSDADFNNNYSCNVLCSDVEPLVSAVESLAAGVVRAMGVAAVPSLILNATANVDVTLQPAMADSGYDAYASLFAGVSLSNLQINSVTVVDQNTVTVAVQNVGLVTLAGASVMVHAVA